MRSSGRSLACLPGHSLPLHVSRGTLPTLPCPGLCCSWVNLFNKDALIKFVPTVAACLSMIFTLEHFSHPLALPSGAVARATFAAPKCELCEVQQGLVIQLRVTAGRW